jgi:hypothetical protein
LRGQFYGDEARGKSAAVKALATLLYARGNMSFCGIARLLNGSDVAVLNCGSEVDTARGAESMG